jgi:hypothetical protein
LCTLCCQFLWIVLFWLPLSVFSNVYLSCVPYVASFSGLSFFDCHFRYSLTFIYLVYPMLPVSGFSFFDCPFRYSLMFIYLVYPMLPVSLDCPFLIALSVCSNVYLSCVPYVASFYGLSFFDCHFRHSLTFIRLKQTLNLDF